MSLSKLLKKLLLPKNFPIFLFLIIFITYGYQLMKMGIYWDDWQAILLSNIDVPGVFFKYYLNDRPFSIWTYLLALPITQNYAFAWQIYNIFARWLAGFGLWLFLRGLFPQREKESAWITLIWSVYPGFVSQSVSIAFVQHFLTYALFNFSLAGMVWSIRLPQRRLLLTLLSLLSSMISLFTMEYFLGLEALRPIILWFLLECEVDKKWLRIRMAFSKWLPYLSVVCIFVLFRFWIMNLINQGVSANQPTLLVHLLKDPLNTIILFIQIVLQDSYHMIFHSFTNALVPSDIDLNSRIFLFSIFIGISLSILFLLFSKEYKSGDQSTNDLFYRNATIISLLAVFLGGIPVWGIEKQVIVGLWSDRFSLAPMFGVSILVVIIIQWITQKKVQRNILLVTITVFSIASQIRIVNDFSYNWLEQRRFYWQLLWRIPSLESGTAVLSPKMPFGSVAEYSISYAINTFFSEKLTSQELPYGYLSALRYRGRNIADFYDDNRIYSNIRTVFYEGNTSNAIVFYEAPKQRCIWFVTQDDALLPDLDNDTIDLFGISHLNQISNNILRNDEVINMVLGPEVDHNWCYYFQKAELAVQFHDWQTTIKLWDEAKLIGDLPEHGREYFPFIIAYAHIGNWVSVHEESVEALRISSDIKTRICALWDQIEDETPDSKEKIETLALLRTKYNCD